MLTRVNPPILLKLVIDRARTLVLRMGYQMQRLSDVVRQKSSVALNHIVLERVRQCITEILHGA